ncbi:REJ domain-containing protein, partial [Trichonephila clavata]
MDCNRVLLLLIHIQVGLSQLSFNKMLDTQTEPVQQNGFFQNVQLLGAKEFTDCESLGFRNATKNACGFCTGGSTKLSDRYFMDCMGECNGNSSSIDCNGDCLGTAYVDQCSNECVEKDVQVYRNCRGDCISSRDDKLNTDNCGVCHFGTSPFLDCTNTCYLPNKEKQMAKIQCGRCVGGTTGILESQVLDPCGNCRSDDVECPCNGTGKPDACGICNGGGTSCLRVSRFHPRALPANTKAMVEIEGAFHGRERNIKCVFALILGDQIHNKTEFFGSGNGTLVQCLVQLQVGMYRVGVRLEVGDPKEDFIEDSELLVYGQVGYTSMSPKQAVLYRRGPQELIVTFTGSKVPRLPLICIISGDELPEQKRLAPSEADTLDSCIIPYPKSSVELSVAQSFNGIHIFNTVFSLKFYAPPPAIKYSYLAEDGHAIVTLFDKPVNLSNLDECSKMLNSETLTRLGAGAVCKWASKQQLIISVQNPIKRNPFRVTFQKDVLKQDSQRYSLPETSRLTFDAWSPQPSIKAQIAISGPTIVSYCGEFTLVGHFSSPAGDAEFYWAAYREDKNSLEPSLSNVLSGAKSSSLTLNSSLLEVNTVYIFVLTTEKSSYEKYEAKHQISSVPYIGPLVTAYSDVVTQPSVTVDQRVTLRADLTIPDCSTTYEHVRLMWSVNNPEVKFNFKSKSSYVYVIEPFSLPENSTVIFYANAYFGNTINVTFSRIELRVEPLKLKAAIKGTFKRVVGNKFGKLILESEKMRTGFPLTYHWRCFDQAGSVCYNYEENATESLLIPKRIQNKPKLEIPCVKLKAGKKLEFDLQVFNAKNSFQFGQSAPTTVFVEDKDIPQCILLQHLEYINVPAGLPVAVYAAITSARSPLRSVKWDFNGFPSTYTFTTRNNKSVLLLEEGSLVGTGIYLIGLSACDIKGACGYANISIFADPGLSLCKVKLKPYVEYETVRVEINGCSIPIGRQPVTYQLYLHSRESVFPFTTPQISTIFNIVGPPQQISNGTQISAQACDKYMLCTLFYGPITVVALTESREEDREKLMKKATLAIEN